MKTLINKSINKAIYKNVVLWNKRINNKPYKNKEQRKFQIINQLKYLAEEMNEFKEANECNDIVEMFDAICDIVIVSNYLPRLCHNKKLVKSYKINFDNNKQPINEILALIGNDLYDINKIIKNNYSFKEILFTAENIFRNVELYVCYFIQYLYNIGYTTPSELYLNAIKEVIDTNNNKFLYNKNNASKMLPSVIKYYDNRFENIVIVESYGAYLFRADNGLGKVVKPVNWKSPDIKSILDIAV